MNPSQMTPTERDQLLDALIDGSITDEQRLRIEAELIIDKQTRKTYYNRLQLDLLLEREVASFGNMADDDSSEEIEPIGKETGPRVRNPAFKPGRSLAVGILIGLAASLFVAFFIYTWQSPQINQPGYSNKQDIEPSAVGFALLRGHDQATWIGQSPEIGDLLSGGEQHLRSGKIHVEFFSGAQMVIEGDAKFSIDSPMQVTLLSGIARASVPEAAHGFTIKTNSGDVIDQGTEFTIDAHQDHAIVRVIEGKVELRTSKNVSQTISKGDKYRLDHERIVSVAGDSADNLDITSPADFATQMQANKEDRFSKWETELAKSNSDSRLIGHYRFLEKDLPRRIVSNNASPKIARASDGAIVATEVSADRWGRSGSALNFNHLGSRVRVNVPGEHRGITMNCWVKINSLDRWYNSLFLTDGHEDREPHWQIMDDGRIFFSVKVPAASGKNKPAKQHEFYSPSIWDASMSGRWVMLSVTYDVDAKVVSHFLNGAVISSESIPDSALVEVLHIGDASICNWNEPMYRTDAKFVLRNLNGSMDEFAIYSGSLSTKEISELYRLGTPHEN